MMYVGTAGWSLKKELHQLFPTPGTHLQKYSAQLNATEINSSFYKDHQPKSYARWAEETPPDFRFSVKVPKRFTHEQSLKVSRKDLQEFLAGPLELGPKLRVLLVQLPPSHVHDATVARAFFETLRELHAGVVALEPRHPTWARPEAFEALEPFDIHPVLADPGLKLLPFVKGSFCYHRLHGSPEVYKSDYPPEFLQALGVRLQDRPEAWCIFDNTTYGYATLNALEMRCPVGTLDSAPALKLKMRDAFHGANRLGANP